MPSKITGRDRLRYVLTKLPKEQRTQLKTAVLVGAHEISDMQKRLSSSDRVRDEINVTPAERNVSRYMRLRSKRQFPDPELAAIISSDSFIAPFEEFGTAPHLQAGRFEGTMHPGTSARPSFYPGYRASKKRVQARINKAAKKAIKDGIK